MQDHTTGGNQKDVLNSSTQIAAMHTEMDVLRHRLAALEEKPRGQTNRGRSLRNVVAMLIAMTVLMVLANAPLVHGQSVVDALFISAEGNVGIGTTNPASKLDVNGAIKATSITVPTINGTSINATSITASSITAPTINSTDGITTNKLDVNGDIRGSFIVRPGGTYQNGAIFSDANWGMLFRSAQANPNSATFSFADTNNRQLLTIVPNGNVGIGTSTPTRGKLEVIGSTSMSLKSVYVANKATWDQFTYWGVPGGNGDARIPLMDERAVNIAHSISIYASSDVAANGFAAFSDARIKRIARRSDGVEDLATLLGIEVTDYTYIDTLAKGTRDHRKVIGQQVETVYPQAVSRSTDVVPDIYQQATIKDGWVMLATDLQKGERVRLIGNAMEGIHEVLEVTPDGFRTDFVADGDTVFVYGREVKDFLSVDYDAIAMLNVSATQELARLVQQQADDIKLLKKCLIALEQAVSSGNATAQAECDAALTP